MKVEKKKVSSVKKVNIIKKSVNSVKKTKLSQIKNKIIGPLKSKEAKSQVKPEIKKGFFQKIPIIKKHIMKPKTGRLSEGEVKKCQKELELVRKEIANAVVGQDKVISGLLRAILSKGHVLVEGVPGIAKTLIIRVLAHVTTSDFKRIQFTADLLPTDIIGLTTYDPKMGFSVVKGPVFTNFLLADEINRAPAKVQSALLEAMQEKQVTIGKNSLGITEPFFVLATQNPIESVAIFPLPEAQMDRFLFKLFIGYPDIKEERAILQKNMTISSFENFNLRSVISSQEIIRMQEITKRIYLSPEVENYIVRLVDATRFPDKYKLKNAKYVGWGSSPRAGIGMFIASKADALLDGKNYVTPKNVKNIAHDVLRHRIILNYEGQAENLKTDDIISEILLKVPTP